MRYLLLLVVLFSVLFAPVVKTNAGGNDCPPGSTTVPGHCKYDQDNNGYPDAGVEVNGHYTQTIGDYEYVVNYRGSFNNDPYLDSGWIINSINNKSGEHWTYLIVHKSDPRYRGIPEWSIWGDWEYHVLAGSGFGNFVRPENHSG